MSQPTLKEASNSSATLSRSSPIIDQMMLQRYQWQNHQHHHQHYQWQNHQHHHQHYQWQNHHHHQYYHDEPLEICTLAVDVKTSRSKGYDVAKYDNAVSARTALTALDGRILNDYKLNAEPLKVILVGPRYISICGV
eukprot:490473_1